jgi:hypothetical protein
MAKSLWLMMPVLSPTFSAISSLRPLVLTGVAMIAGPVG